jgi:hypothetical protein
MQIAGNMYKICGAAIVLSSDGEHCAYCGTYAHVACESGSNCSVCGKPLERYQRPQANPLAEAILPRSLRPAGTGGPALAVGMIFLFAVIVFLFYSCIPSGH